MHSNRQKNLCLALNARAKIYQRLRTGELLKTEAGASLPYFSFPSSAIVRELRISFHPEHFVKPQLEHSSPAVLCATFPRTLRPLAAL